MKKAGKKVKARFEFLEQQIQIQENALIKCCAEEAIIHGYLLQKVTNEWCEILKTYGNSLYE